MADEKYGQIIVNLQKVYTMELETVINYLANSVTLDGVRAEEIKKSLQADIQAELTHATQLAHRLKTIGGAIPGSQSLQFHQSTLQPPADTTDVVAVIKGVLDAEESAITEYTKLIKLCDGVDYVTQDLCIQILGDEESHRREFRGYLSEYEKMPTR
jgi:bacterioferritin